MLKKIYLLLINLTWHFNPEFSTKLYMKFLKKRGANISDDVNYLSAKIWFDGADYSKFTIGKQVTISSNVRLLTHDWSPYTAVKAYGVFLKQPIGVFGRIEIHDYAFVGTGATILPDTIIGKGAIVGAGSVVKGNVEPFSIVIGNPAKKIGTTKDFIAKNFPELGI